MAKVIATTQSSLLLQPHATLTGRGFKFISDERIVVSSCFKPISSSRQVKSGNNQLHLASVSLSHYNIHVHKGISAIPVSMASSLDVEVTGEQVEIKPDFTGGGGDEGVNGGGGGGGGGGGDDNDGNKGDEGSDDADAKRNKALLMSQKFTLGFAALVGLGGLMGYLKSGSQKSLAFGGLSALLLYYVYTELPKRPVFASSVGLGLSAALLVVMGSRFKKSGKVFPAGIVSFVSLIMTGGYLHGIMKAH
ncbi:uncharacterized protein LOC141611470 [Silene latifolia]|uniref:uncharacterized protein LOC141611470 n=1 Tax=Silene latifolia TaxID=37657 RepID=UPI003D771DF2